MRRALAAVAFGFSLAFLLAFTAPTAPARHPSSPTDLAKPYVYVFDPYASGASSGVPNATPKDVSACGSTQAIGFSNTGSALSVVCIDATTQGATTGPPSTPSGDQSTAFFYQVDAGFWPIAASIDATGLVTPTGAFSSFKYLATFSNWDTWCAMPRAWSDTVFSSFFTAFAPTVVGSTGSVAWSSANFLGRLKAVSQTSSAATNSGAGVSSNSGGFQNAWRGNAAGAGGFLWWERVNFFDTKATARFGAGLFNSVAAFDTANDPSAATNTVYFGCDSGDSNLSICSNDNTGTATCTTLGASYPCTTDGAAYDLWLSAAPNSGGISWAIIRLDSAASTGGFLTSDLPQNTVQLNWKSQLNTGPSNGTAVIMHFYGSCMAANL